MTKLFFIGGLLFDALCEIILLSKGRGIKPSEGDDMTKTVNKSLEEVKQDAQNKGMEIVEHSAFPYQYLKGLVLIQGDIIIHAWALSESETRLDRHK